MTDETEDEDLEQTEELSANDVWEDVDPEQEGAAPDEFQEMELADGRPVLAKYVREGAIQRYRKEIRARNDNIDEDELGERVVVKILKDHYRKPDFSYLTHKKYQDAKTGYYDKFLNPIAPELQQQAQNL